MLKNLVKLEFVVAEKLYHFLCDNDSPLEHIKEALFQCQHYIAKVEENVKAQAVAAQEQLKTAEEAPVQEPSPEGEQISEV